MVTLQQIPGTPAPAGPHSDVAAKEEYLDGQNLMQMLHLSPRTLRYWRSRGILPFKKIERKIFYKRSELDEILKTQRETVRGAQNKAAGKRDKPVAKN